MKIGFIGYGSMATALSTKWVGRHELHFGGRNLDKARAVAARFDGAGHGSEADAAAFGEVVVLATRHEHVFDAIDAAGGPDAFAGKTVLDINNPYEHETSLNKHYDGRSLSEAIADRLPDAHVVKAFNMCQARVWQMNPPTFDGRRLVTMYCGDDANAKAQVRQLIEDVGSDTLDLGALRYARLLEPAAAIVIKMLFAGRDPHTVLNLIQPEVKPIGE